MEDMQEVEARDVKMPCVVKQKSTAEFQVIDDWSETMIANWTTIVVIQ